MASDPNSLYQSYLKRAWVIYALLILVLIVVLVLFVASDNEERFFFTIMPAAGGYVLRPTERFMARMVHKFTGVSKPVEGE